MTAAKKPTAFQVFLSALGAEVDRSLAADTARRSAAFAAAPTAYLMGELTRRGRLHEQQERAADRVRDARTSAREGKLARRCLVAVAYLTARAAR